MKQESSNPLKTISFYCHVATLSFETWETRSEQSHLLSHRTAEPIVCSHWLVRSDFMLVWFQMVALLAQMVVVVDISCQTRSRHKITLAVLYSWCGGSCCTLRNWLASTFFLDDWLESLLPVIYIVVIWAPSSCLELTYLNEPSVYLYNVCEKTVPQMALIRNHKGKAANPRSHYNDGLQCKIHLSYLQVMFKLPSHSVHHSPTQFTVHSIFRALEFTKT